MFVAINPNGEKQLAFREDKERLYSLSKAKELYCPHCQKNVFYRGGQKRIHHFYHERHVNITAPGAHTIHYNLKFPENLKSKKHANPIISRIAYFLFD